MSIVDQVNTGRIDDEGVVFFGSQSFDPLTLSPYFWFDFSDAATVTLNGSTVAQIDDKSGAARHASQGTGALQPTYTVGGQNGLNCATFTVTQFLANASLTPTTTNPFMMFAVAKFDDASTANRNMCGDAVLFRTNGGTWQLAATLAVNSGVTDDALAHVFTARASGATSYLRLDGAEIASGNIGTGTFGALSIGRSASGWTGTICEMLCCPEPTDTLRDNFIAALKTKWATV